MSEKAKDVAAVTGAAALGAAAGQGAYQGYGYGVKHLNRKINNPKVYKDPKRQRGFTKTEYKKKIEGVKDKHGKREAGRVTDWKSVYRNYPTDVPGGKILRLNSYTHSGKTGVAVGTAATLASAAGAAKVTKDKVEKSMNPHAADPFNISKISVKTKLIAGAKRGLFDAAGVTHPKLREKAYGGNDPVKSKVYRWARTKSRKEMEPRLIALRNDPAVKRAAFRIVREETGKAVRRAGTAAKNTGKTFAPTAAGGAVGAGTYAAVDNKKKLEGAKNELLKKHYEGAFLAKNLTQEQIDRRKKVQSFTSKTTGTLGLAALGAQGVGLAVSRGKLKKLPTFKDGKPGLEAVKQTDKGRRKAADKIKAATVPALATSAGVGSVGAFNFASYTKAEANQRKH